MDGGGKQVLSELRAHGVVMEAFRLTPGGGVVSFLRGENLAEVTASMDRLPFVANGLLTFDYSEMDEL